MTHKDRVPDTPPPAAPPEGASNDNAGKKKFSLRAAFKYAFSRKGAEEIRDLFIETAKDIVTSPKEAAFAAFMIILMPGGQPLYLAHRIRKHILLKKAANDNAPQPAPSLAPPKTSSKPPAPKP